MTSGVPALRQFARWHYLVALLGERTNRAHNARAAERAPILRGWLQRAPRARAHMPIDRRAPLEELARIAERFPVLHITRSTEDRTMPSVRDAVHPHAAGTPERFLDTLEHGPRPRPLCSTARPATCVDEVAGAYADTCSSRRRKTRSATTSSSRSARTSSSCLISCSASTSSSAGRAAIRSSVPAPRPSRQFRGGSQEAVAAERSGTRKPPRTGTSDDLRRRHPSTTSASSRSPAHTSPTTSSLSSKEWPTPLADRRCLRAIPANRAKPAAC